MVNECQYDLKKYKSAHYANGGPDDEKDEASETYITQSNVEVEDDAPIVEAVLWTKENRKVLRREALGSAVIDSGCSDNCTSRTWAEDYVERLSAEKKKKVLRRFPSKGTKFKFGAGDIQIASEEITVPGELVGEECFFKISIVENSDIPFLWSRKAMAKAGVKIDLATNTPEILGKRVIPNFTAAGHMCINILPSEGGNEGHTAKEIYATLSNNEDEETLRKRLTHLHRQYGHQYLETELKFFRSSSSWKAPMSSILKDIHEKCKICAEFRKEIPRPVAKIPITTDFNEEVCVGLKDWKIRDYNYIMYMVDSYTRYTMAVFVKNKEAETICKAFLSSWMSVHNQPQRLFSDNGLEFVNKVMKKN